jgi:uncharacterized protein YdhG (YjbR/CyaY superfamily)
MTPGKARPKTITDYINAAPKEARKKLREMHRCICQSAPGAEEGLKWGMPAFSYRRILVAFAAHKHHIGFYPTPSAVKAFAKNLSKFVTATGSIQFSLEKPLPLPLIRKITAFRVRESIEKGENGERDGRTLAALKRSQFPTCVSNTPVSISPCRLTWTNSR